MYETINGYPVKLFLKWYNEKYDADVEKDTLEFEMSKAELEVVAEMFTEDMENI